MNKILLVVAILAFSNQALSHSGRTDKNGGHNCSQKSVNKGLCSGYHYHGSSKLDASEMEKQSIHEHDVEQKHSHEEITEIAATQEVAS